MRTVTVLKYIVVVIKTWNTKSPSPLGSLLVPLFNVHVSRLLGARLQSAACSGSANCERATGDDCEYKYVGRAVAAVCAPDMERIIGLSSRHAHSFSILKLLFTCFFSSLTCKWLTHIRARQSALNSHLLKSSIDGALITVLSLVSKNYPPTLFSAHGLFKLGHVCA